MDLHQTLAFLFRKISFTFLSPIADDNYVDLISSLPDEILEHILSFVPTKFAIRTSVLSRRWKKIWCETTSLYFDDCYRLSVDSLNKTLVRYTTTKIMNFHFSTSYFVTDVQIHDLIEFAMSRNTKKLSLEFDQTDFSRCNFPDFFYNCSFLEQLTLNVWSGAMTPRCIVSWTSLKSLSLLFKSLPDEYVAKILSGCPVLESLALSFYDQLRFLDLSKSPRLNRLDIHCKDWMRVGFYDRLRDLDLGKSTVIVAPYIHYLRLRNPEIPEIRFTLLDVSSLTEADLDLTSLFSTTTFSMDSFQKMLTKFENVNQLTLGANFLRVLSFAELHGVLFRTVNLETLTLEIVIFGSVLTSITKILQTSPRLKKISIHIKKKDTILLWSQHIFSSLESKGVYPYQFRKLEDGNYLTPLDNIPALMGMELEAKFVFCLVEYLLGKTKTVETMVVLLGKDISATVFNELLQMVPTLSGNNKVSIVLKQKND